jgi:hypothetical protein
VTRTISSWGGRLSQSGPRVRWWITVCAVGAAAVAFLLCLAWSSHGSLGAVRAWLDGLPIAVDDPIKVAPATAPGTAANFTFSLQNVSGSKLTVYGAISNCSCITQSEIPFTIQPNECKDLAFKMRIASNESREQVIETVELLTDGHGASTKLKLVTPVSHSK